jgi:hypothetical protein
MARFSALAWMLVSVLAAPMLAQGGAQQEAETRKGEIAGLTFIGGSAKVPAGKLAVLDVSEEQVMRITWKGGSWELPYSRVQTLYVSLSRPSAMVEMAGATYGLLLLGALRGRKGFLSVRYEDPDGDSQTCWFLVPPGGALESVQILAKKSNRNIVFESEEARRRLQGRK